MIRFRVSSGEGWPSFSRSCFRFLLFSDISDQFMKKPVLEIVDFSLSNNQKSILSNSFFIPRRSAPTAAHQVTRNVT